MSFLEKIKKVKHIEIIVAVIAVVIMLGIYFSGFLGKSASSSKKNNTSTASSSSPEYYSDYCERMANELNATISKIQGAGKTQVMISWESSVELILAYNLNNSSSSSSSSPIIINSGGVMQPLITKEIYPKALGIVVVCEGGNDPKIKVSIVMSVSTLFEIAADKVLVYAYAK